ncbi:hypothetical protein [Chlorogloeopsis sp. ULAP02]
MTLFLLLDRYHQISLCFSLAIAHVEVAAIALQPLRRLRRQQS